MNVYMPLPFYLCLPLHSMLLFCTVAEDTTEHRVRRLRANWMQSSFGKVFLINILQTQRLKSCSFDEHMNFQL